ncbi:MAG: LexA family transcriptional regulator [Lewinellaceae bacterium]|nr:LexA family transcriptional regulator [Saprospiraceae bacterium]MCB9269441.1 LexA family transcriptional regulator [Lewinellaceae bacterium]HPQ98507.1 S24 family peptidase [Saprospiraceae bacterium]
MNHIVSQRFVKCLEKLKEENKIPSSRQFALSLEYQPQNLHEIQAGNRDVTIDLIRRAIENYQFNPEYLFLGQGSMFSRPEKENDFRLLTVVTDQYNDERIVHVPIPAQAGYTSAMADSEFYSDLPSYSLPDYKYKVGTYRSFDIAGDSMEPSLFEGDKVICTFCEPGRWMNCIKDNCVYVVVTRSDIFVKRVKNRMTESKQLELVSDNAYYEPFMVDIDDVRELWYVQTKMTSFSHTPLKPAQAKEDNLPGQEFEHLKQVIAEQSKLIKQLHNTIEKLVNSSITT